MKREVVIETERSGGGSFRRYKDMGSNLAP